MKHLIFTYQAYNLTLSILISSCAIYAQTNKNSVLSGTKMEKLAKAASFEELFVKQKSISLSESTIVGEVSILDVGSNGNLLVTDQVGRSVFLFDGMGKLVRELSAQDIQPGLQWRPIMARFSPQNYIIVNLSAEPLFLFDPSGLCLKKIQLLRFSPLDVCLDQRLDLYGYNFYQNEFYLSRVDTALRNFKKFGSIPEDYKNYVSHVEEAEGRLIIDGEGYLYQVDVSGPDIHKYSSDGELLKVFRRYPGYLKKLPSDLPNFTNPEEFLRKSNKIIMESTPTISIHLLAPRLLLIQYFIWRSGLQGLDICDVTGNYLLTHDILTPERIKAAKDSKIYTVTQPEMQADGHLPNPIINVYGFLSN